MQNVATILQSYDVSARIAMLLSCLSSNDQEVKCEVYELTSILLINYEINNEPLLLLCQDADVRYAACHILGNTRDQRTEDIVLDLLKHENHPHVRFAAVEALFYVETTAGFITGGRSS